MAWSKQQGRYVSNSGEQASLAYSSNLQANSTLVVTVWWNTTSTVPTVSGTQNTGNFTCLQSCWDSTDLEGVALYACVNTKGAVAETINASYGAVTTYTALSISEFVGGPL